MVNFVMNWGLNLSPGLTVAGKMQKKLKIPTTFNLPTKSDPGWRSFTNPAVCELVSVWQSFILVARRVCVPSLSHARCIVALLLFSYACFIFFRNKYDCSAVELEIKTKNITCRAITVKEWMTVYFRAENRTFNMTNIF